MVPAAAGPEEPVTVAHIVVEAADIRHAPDLVGKPMASGLGLFYFLPGSLWFLLATATWASLSSWLWGGKHLRQTGAWHCSCWHDWLSNVPITSLGTAPSGVGGMLAG